MFSSKPEVFITASKYRGCQYACKVSRRKDPDWRLRNALFWMISHVASKLCLDRRTYWKWCTYTVKSFSITNQRNCFDNFTNWLNENCPSYTALGLGSSSTNYPHSTYSITHWNIFIMEYAFPSGALYFSSLLLLLYSFSLLGELGVIFQSLCTQGLIQIGVYVMLVAHTI